MKQCVAVIDFGTSKIVTVVGEPKPSSPCEILGHGIVSYDGFMAGRWNNPSTLQASIARSIQDAEKSSGQKISSVFVGVPGEFIRVVLNELSMELRSSKRRISDMDIEQLMSSTASVSVPTGGEVIQRSAAWFAVDGERTMEPAGLRGEKLSSMASFIAADTQFMKDVSERLRDLGVEVVDYASSSLAEAMMLIPMEEREKTAVLIDVGYLSTELLVVEGDALTYHEVLPLGGGHITADISQNLSVSMAMAEQLKRKTPLGTGFAQDAIEITDDQGRIVSFERESVTQSVAPCVGELMGMLSLVLGDSNVSIPARALIYLTGGGIAMMRGGKDYIAGVLGRAVKTPLPRGTRLNAPLFSSSVGLLDICCDSLNGLEESSGIMQKVNELIGRFVKK